MLAFLLDFASALSDVDIWQQSEKVEHGVQLQTFPHPSASKSFLHSNAVMAHKLDVHKRDGQTDR